ncbi:MAG: UDP-glucose 4-epimerase GalE [Proteobacteria bacterium]|nr:UDP-glucose 4-epimerase GalE [Pseudomonadota bacterium]
MSKRVLVVGGAGYIGSHACKILKRAGYTPIVFDNLVYGHEDAIKWGAFEQGDIRSRDDLDRAFSQHNPEYVMHFAAFAYVGESVLEPSKYYENNLVGSISLIEAMRRHGVEKIVFSSTCATYGEVATLPIHEATPQNPVNPYGFTKLAVENVLRDYGRAYGIRSVALRYFNAAGCDPEGELGERHTPETHAVPLAILAALGHGVFNIFGTDYPTPDGTAIRDYVHVNDLADAHVRALAYLDRCSGSAAMNLATGQGTSVKQLIKAVERATGCTVPVRYMPRRAGDPPVLYASSEQAAELLGWQPSFTDVNLIVETAARWFMRRSASFGSR